MTTYNDFTHIVNSATMGDFGNTVSFSMPGARFSHVLKRLQLLFICSFCVVALAGTGRAESTEYVDFKSPIFEDVERVYVHVHYSVGLSKEDQAALPAPLQRKNIEGLLMKIYNERFSSKDCRKYVKSKELYSCNDQPVTLLSDAEYGTYELQQEMKKPGSLNVLFQVKYMKSDDFREPMFAFYIVQDRSESNIPLILKISFPYALPASMDDKTTYKWLSGYIENRIQ